MKVSLQRVINTNYVRYDKLLQMINYSFANSNANHINIYIDLYSIIKSICGNNVQIDDYSDFTSCIINMCTHYRAFFKTRYSTASTIYIINTLNKPSINSKLCSEYNDRTTRLFAVNDKVMDMVANNINLLKIITPYLDNIYLINRPNQESSVVMYDLMCRDIGNERGHMIITKDKYLNRLCIMKPQTIIVRPKKKNNEDLSTIITPLNILERFFEDKKVKTRSQILAPDMINYLMTLCGCEERNITSIQNISSAVKLLENLVREMKIPNRYTPDFDTVLGEVGSCINTPGMILSNRFKCIDIQYQHMVYCANPTNIDYSLDLVDMVDNDTIRDINNKYFIKNPLDLNRI